MGRQTAGVQGMKFRNDDSLLAMDVVPGDSDKDLFVVTNEASPSAPPSANTVCRAAMAWVSRPCNWSRAVVLWSARSWCPKTIRLWPS